MVTVDASPSEPGQSRPPSWWEAVAALGASERLAALGCVVSAGSTLLPWYKAPVGGLVKTGMGAFGFAIAALLLTSGAALALLIQAGRGRRPPLPLHEGTLLAVAGGWTAVIVVYLMLDRPQFTLAGFDQTYSLAYGVFVALGGAALMIVAGLRLRRTEISGEGRLN